MTKSLTDTGYDILNDTGYDPVGRCIYCESTYGLSREHILPFGLSGTAVLHKASCAECAKITGQIEGKLLRGPMQAVRVYRGLKSRSKHKDAPETYPLTIVKDGKEEITQLSASEYPILLHFPLFSVPALLNPEDYVSGIRMSGTASVSFGPKPEEVAKRLGAQSVTIPQSYEPVAFARMLAKIAYSYAVAEAQLDLIDGECFLIPAILGHSDDIGKWVGTITSDTFKSHPGILHRLEIIPDYEKGLLVGEVQLFSDSEAPRYGVILGRLR